MRVVTPNTISFFRLLQDKELDSAFWCDQQRVLPEIFAREPHHTHTIREIYSAHDEADTALSRLGTKKISDARIC